MFGDSGYDGAVVDSGESVFVQRVAALEGSLTDGYVVHFGAGEVLEGGSVGSFGQEADVYLESVAQAEAYFVLALRYQVCDGRIGGSVVYGSGDFVLRAGWAGYEDVEVSVGFAASAERPGGFNGFEAGEVFQVGDELFGGGFGYVDQEASAVLFVVFDAFAEFFYLLCSEAGESG